MAETTTVRETERKYSGEPIDADLAAALATASAEATNGGAGPPRDPAECALSAVYFDTEDLRLARSGITLRRRTGGDDDGWHLSFPPARTPATRFACRRRISAPHPPRWWH